MANNDEDSCDIDTLAALLDEDECNAPNSTLAPNDESTLLKKKLEEMEKQMAQLKEQLNQKNEKSATVKPKLKDVGLDFTPTPSVKTSSEPKPKRVLHHEQSESEDEDEEGNRISRKYNEFGEFVKQRLAHQPTGNERVNNNPQNWKSKQQPPTEKKVAVKKEESVGGDGFIDAFFGIRIVNPLIGSMSLQQRMEGRKQIKLSLIKMHMRGGDIKEDWVTMAVVVFKSPVKTSQKGKKFAIWKLCDLRDCNKVVSLFLFGDVFTTHWKMAVGSVIGILNPNFMKDNSPEEVSFTVDNHQKVLHIGSSKDLGYCKANRKDGTRCPSYVNKSECEFCIYHVQAEFKKSSAKRSEIQSSFSGTGLSTKDRLKQKVLGKQEVFYGGQLFSGKVVAAPASKVKDNKILSSLRLQDQAKQLKEDEEKLAMLANVKTEFSQRLKNPTAGSRNLMRCLQTTSSPGGNATPSKPLPTSPAPIKSITAKDLLLQHKMQLSTMNFQKNNPLPQLGRGLQQDAEIEIDLSQEIGKSSSRLDSAKLKALRLVKLKGPLKASNPNKVTTKAATLEMKEKVRKRALNQSDDKTDAIEEQRASKRSKVLMDAMFEAKSSHSHLVDELEVQQSHEYFSKMEKKEQMETKMLSTFEVKTTAVTCPKCKYTAVSASEICRKEGHPTRTIKVVKRFFQCKDCRNRTISFDRLPKRSCTNCGGSNWERAAMAKERKGPLLPHEELKLRGEELKNLNS